MSEQPFAVEALCEVLDFDPKTGIFTWKKPASPRLKVGDRAGSVMKNGRREINVLGRRCFAHHLAWFYHYGEWPTEYVRQKNNDFDDCRIENLYRQTPSEMQLGVDRVGPSGFRGVSFDSKRGRFQATIRRKYKQQHLGYFDTAEEAHAAFIEADKTFRPDVSAEEMEAVATKFAISRRRKALWSLLCRSAGDVVGWEDENDFLAEVGDPPTPEHCVSPVDLSRAVGPDNWCWVRPMTFDRKTPEGRRAYDKHRRETNPAPFRNGDLKKTFGITLAEYQAMHDAQHGLCAICGKAETATRDGKTKWLAVDHCHKTNAIRQLLCQRCNVLIGHCDDDSVVLRAAAAYIERHAKEDSDDRPPGS